MAASRGPSERSRQLVVQIVDHVKAQGIFDQFRRDCLEELEQKESYRQLKQRVESHVATFLSKQEWTDSLPKNQVRDSLRRNFHQSEVLQKGVERLVSQALNEKAGCFRDRIGDVVQTFMFTEQHQEAAHTLKQEQTEGKGDQKGAKSDVKLGSDISQIIPYSQQIHSSALVGKAEHKPKFKTTENSRAVAGRKTEDHAMTKASQAKPVMAKTVASAQVAPEVDQNTAKRALLDPVFLVGNDATDAGNAVHERQTSGADPQTFPNGNIFGKTETKENKTEEKGVPITLHMEQKEVSFLDTRQSEEALYCLDEETEEVEAWDEGHAQPSRNCSPTRFSEPSVVNMLVDTNANSSNKPFLDYNAWSPDNTEHAAGLSRPESQGTHQKAEQDEGKGTTSDLSDAHSDISEVSSVHTSDLSSFDDQVSSVTDDEENQSPQIDDSDEDGNDTAGAKHGRPRRSTRISSRRSTREDEEGQNELKRDQVKGTAGDATGAEERREPRKDGQDVETVKRKRGRPRKTDRPSSLFGHRKSHLVRKKKTRRKDETQESEGESSDVGRKRSQRRIKRTRCYSPSSEGTREVHLPYKRSRVNSKD